MLRIYSKGWRVSSPEVSTARFDISRQSRMIRPDPGSEELNKVEVVTAARIQARWPFLVEAPPVGPRSNCPFRVVSSKVKLLINVSSSRRRTPQTYLAAVLCLESWRTGNILNPSNVTGNTWKERVAVGSIPSRGLLNGKRRGWDSTREMGCGGTRRAFRGSKGRDGREGRRSALIPRYQISSGMTGRTKASGGGRA